MQPLHRISASDLQRYLETPEELLTESEEIQIAFASFSETPRSLLEILVNSDCSTVVEVARLHVNFAGEITGDYQETVAELLQNLDLGQNDRLAVELMQFATVAPCFLSEWVPERRVIQGLQNEYMPLRYRLQFLERLSQSDKLEARLIVAESLETPVSLLELLAGDLELAVRLTVESNPNCPSEVVELVKSQHDLVNDWDADVERLRELGESRWSWIRLTVAQNPFAPEDVLIKLATDELFKIRLGVVKNPNSSARVLGILAEESLRLMQVAVVEHPNIGEETLHQLFTGYKSEIEKRNDLPRSILERFFREKEYKNVYLFISNHDTPIWILAELANIDIEALRIKAIERRDSSPIIETFEHFFEEETSFLTRIAKHPQVSVDILEHLTQYPNSYLKLAIAENPKISEELRISLLQQLSANLKANIRIKIASNLQTPIVILEQLANASYKFDGMEDLFRLLAPDITPNLLKQIQEFIDKNQSPELVLFWLNQGIEFRDSVLEEWTTLVNSLNQSEKQTLEYLANQESLLDWEGRYTARRRSNKRGGFSFSSNELAKNHHILDGLMHLANTQYNSDRANQEVVAALLGNPSLPIYLRERLWEQYKINPDNERDYLEDFDIRLALANNPQIPEAERINYFQEIISKNPDYARRIARDARTPVNILEQLLERGICKEEIAKNPAIPEYLLRRIADERKEYLWRTLAENPSTPIDLLYRFLKEKVEKTVYSNQSMFDLVLDITLRYANTPTSVLELLVENRSETYVLCDVAKHSNVTSDILTSLSVNQSAEVRETVASQQKCPSEILETLAYDSAVEVKQKVATNQNTPNYILESFAQSEDSAIRTAVASNPNLSPTTLEQLANDEKVEVRRTVASNPNTPEIIRENLQNLIPPTQNPHITPTLISLPRIYKPDTDDLPTLLTEYAQSNNPFVRFVTLLHPITPEEILTQAANSPSWLERYAVAENESTPLETRSILARDGNRIVRAAANQNL